MAHLYAYNEGEYSPQSKGSISKAYMYSSQMSKKTNLKQMVDSEKRPWDKFT